MAKGMDVEGGIHINYLDGFEWRWLTDDPIKWHTSYVIDFIAKDGKRYVVMKIGLTFAHGVRGKKCDKALEWFKKAIEEDFKSTPVNQQRREPRALSVTVPNMRLYKVDENSDEWCKELWDEARSYYGNDAEVLNIGFSMAEADTYNDYDITNEENERLFNIWLNKKTEFSKDEFFARVREMMGYYELQECEKGDKLTYTGLTDKVQVSHVNDDGKFVTRTVQLNYEFCATYSERLCSIAAELTGHGEHWGMSSPIKTYEDLATRMEAPYGPKLKRKPIQQTHYEQMSLFDFLQEG